MKVLIVLLSFLAYTVAEEEESASSCPFSGEETTALVQEKTLISRKSELYDLMVERAAEQSGAGKWDVGATFFDVNPNSSSYENLVTMLFGAIDLAHTSTIGPKYDEKLKSSTLNASKGGGFTWERLSNDTLGLTEDQLNPPDFLTSTHAVVLADRSAKRILVAFRGSCDDKGERTCWADQCYLQEYKAYGERSKQLLGSDRKNHCDKYKGIDIVGQARTIVEAAAKTLPGYSVLVTGHSMGGALALATASILQKQVTSIQAIAVAPPNMQDVFQVGLGLTLTDILNLPSRDLFAICDPIDCGIITSLVPQSRQGITTCLYEQDYHTPEGCLDTVNLIAAGKKLNLAKFGKYTKFDCMPLVRTLEHAQDLVLKDMSKRPVCSKELSSDMLILQSSTLGGTPVLLAHDISADGRDSSFDGGLKTSLGEGLIVSVVAKGDGKAARDGDSVMVHYTVREASTGMSLFSTIDREPQVMTVGDQILVEDAGFDRTLKKLAVGGRAVLSVPVDLLKPLDEDADPVDVKIEIAVLRINGRGMEGAPTSEKMEDKSGATAAGPVSAAFLAILALHAAW